MSGFELYPQAWALYIVLGIALLFLLDYKLKEKSFKVRIGLLSLIAVGAFTPQTVSDADSLAPLILVSLLDAEVQGISAIYKGLITLVVIWGIVFTSALALKHFVDARKSQSNNEDAQGEA